MVSEGAFREYFSRSVVKAISHRVVVIIADCTAVQLFTGRADIAVVFVVVSTTYTTVLYFLHERFWDRITWGRAAAKENRIAGIYHPRRKPSPVLEPQERTALLLLVMVLAVLAGVHLVLSAIGDDSFATPYSRSSREGDLVFLSGRVGSIAPTSSGGHLIVTVNGTRVFIPSPASREVSLRVNDTVRIYGIVQVFQGKQEVVVRDAGDIQRDEGEP